MKQLFHGGLVINPDVQKKQDVLVENGRIAAVGESLYENVKYDNIKNEDYELIDISGRLLFPGFIDGHTHMHLEVANTVTADRFDTGTKAAVAGGTTCLVDFATQNKGETLSGALANWQRKAAGAASCDYAFHMAISDWNKDIYEELETIVANGVHSFKLYMTYDAMAMDDQGIYEVLRRLTQLGGIAGVHCENRGIIDARLREVQMRPGGRSNPADYPYTRPALAEAEAVSRLLKIAACANAPVIIVHLSTKEGYEEVQRARERGQDVYIETCPQYLLLDDSCYALEKQAARNYMIAPPLRGPKDRETLWQALREGAIQTVATDHCSFTPEQKAMGAGDFAKTPCGMPGTEERPALMYHYGVMQDRLTLGQMCLYLAQNLAKLYHLYPRKGVIAPGSDADLVVWNPDTEWTISAKTQQSACGYTPYEGTRVKGRAEKVYLRGALVAKNGRIQNPYLGTYIRAI